MFNSVRLARKIAKHVLQEFYNLEKQSPSINSLQELIGQHVEPASSSSLSLDLGCGLIPSNVFCASRAYGIDIRPDHDECVRHANLAVEAIPFPDHMFDYCTAIDFIEHIPRVLSVQGGTRYCFIELMNEIHRILKKGGYFAHLTPAYPSKEAFQDPTHVNIITENTFSDYFCNRENKLAAQLGYGFTGSFELVAQGWHDYKLASILRAL